MITNNFTARHNGVSKASDEEKMLKTIGVSSMEELIDKAVPKAIRLTEPMPIADGINEYEFLNRCRALAQKNKMFKSYIGMGYYGTITPAVIQRNVFENAGWYTAYTPYQTEISQGRLEALMTYQTMVSDMTGLPLANASLLDEATAENPVDATIAMKNAGFSKHANVEGAWNNLTQTWDTNSEAYGDWVAGCFNVQAYDLFQDVTFPKAGVYEVSVQAYYRSGSDTAYEAVWNTPTALHESPLLYAGDVTASIAYLADDADKAPGEGKDYVFGNAPSYVTQDRLFFESGCYRNTIRVSIPADGTTLRIGIKKEGTDWPAQDWFAADNFRLVYYGPEEKTVTLTNGYATFSASSNYAIVGSDVKAYKATEKNGNYIHMEELTDGIPANTGVMLYGAGQTTVTMKPAENATSDVSDNLLKPNVTATAIPAEADGYKNYLLVKSDDKVVFAPSNGNGMLAAGRAYLQLLAGNDAKYFITFGDETGIEMVNSLTPDPSPKGEGSKYVYDLQGRKVAFHSPSGNSGNSWFHSPSKKGVYIVDGKKIVK